jgi:anti-sigma B factor antagonist
MTPVSVTPGADGVLEVTLRGELDYTNAAQVNEVIRTAVAERAPTGVRVDLTAVSFLDSSGIGVIVTALKAARAVRADFRVRGPNAKILNQLEVTGLLELFPVEEA